MCTYLDQVGSTYYFRRAVPLDLRDVILTKSGAPRSEWKISLSTKDREAAKRAIPVHTMETDAAIDRARAMLSRSPTAVQPAKPVERLSDQAQRFIEAREDAMHRAAEWSELEQDAKEHRREELTEYMAFLRQRLKGSTEQMPRHLRAVAYLLEEAGERDPAVIREQYRIAADQKQVMEGAKPMPSLASAALPLIELFDAYATEQQMKAVTANEWRGNLRALIRFVGHDDAARLTVDDVDRWRDALLAETTKRNSKRSPRTVKDKYISALRSTLNYAIGKRKLEQNVAAKVDVRVPRTANFASEISPRTRLAQSSGKR